MGPAFRPGDTGRIGPIVGIQFVLPLPGVGESITIVGGFVAHAAQFRSGVTRDGQRLATGAITHASDDACVHGIARVGGPGGQILHRWVEWKRRIAEDEGAADLKFVALQTDAFAESALATNSTAVHTTQRITRLDRWLCVFIAGSVM